MSLKDFSGWLLRPLKGRWLVDRAELDKLHDWAAQPAPSDIKSVTMEQWHQDTPGGDRRGQTFAKWVSEELGKANQTVSISTGLNPVNVDINAAKADIDSIHAADGGKLMLQDRSVRSIQVNASQDITIERCDIGKLAFHGNARDVLVRDSRVVEISFGKDSSLRNLLWERGYLGTIKLAAAKPFKGDVSFHALTFADDRADVGIQWLRDIRAKLTEMHNWRAAGVFHAVELRHTRKSERAVGRLISLVYSWISDYGNSVGQPLCWFGCCLVGLALLALTSGTATDPAAKLFGWNEILVVSSPARSLYYAFQTILNPLILFGGRPLVALSSPIAAIIGSFISLVGILSLALFLLSVRRRFKLE